MLTIILYIIYTNANDAHFYTITQEVRSGGSRIL